MRTNRTPIRACCARHGFAPGFTLVEMLVAVGLVVLMMSLFATIFQFATQSMGAQKGTAENDQKVRLVMTLLRNDIRHRTMQDVGPWSSGENAASYAPAEANVTQRGGYVYIAENDPDDDTDDILQLTVSADDEPFYGAARVLLPNAAGSFGGAGPSTPGYPNASGSIPPTGQPDIADPGNYWVNQPEFDDGILGLPNGAGSSSAAEVSYFLRKGTLYRRVLLIRTAPGTPLPADAQPKDGSGVNLRDEYYGSIAATIPRNFYTYFDYSGFPLGGVGGAFQFHATNTGPSSLAWDGTYSLGNPSNRFGHNVANGLPREYILNGTTAHFIGRFTHEETSFMSTTGAIQFFGYPGKVGIQSSTYPNPMDDNTATGAILTYDTNTGKVNEYAGGSRVGEDILMTNVMRFDIKVWDEGASFGPDGQPGFANDDTTTVGLNEADDNQNGIVNMANVAEITAEIGWPGSDDGAFVDLGHSGFRRATDPAATDYSFYSRNKLNNPTYCPPNPNKTGTNLYRFDTWCPAIAAQPPFRATDVPAIPGFNVRRRPLKAIQIRITFLDPSTQQLRDVTVVSSLRPQN